MRNIIKMPLDREKRKQYLKQFYLKNKEERIQYQKQWKLNNKEKVNQYQKEYFLKNKEKFNQYQKEYRLKNKEKLKQCKKKWRLKNKEKLNQYRKEYRLKNKEKQKQYEKKWRLNNKEKANQKCKKWRLKNKEYSKKYLSKYEKKRRKIDPNFKLIKYIRSRIWSVLKGIYKSKSTIKLLGCSVEECWQHLESKFQPGMTKENHGLWHVDHIRPCASFNLTDPEQQKICFHYTNLQPLWAEDNLKKGAKYD
jgi:hypothetical protein